MKLQAAVILAILLAACASPEGDEPTPGTPTPGPPGSPPTPAPVVRPGAVPTTPPGREAPTWGTALTGFEGAEPTLGVTSSGALFTVAFEHTLRSRDGGATWEDVFDFSQAGPIEDRLTSDPYLWVDTTTDRVYTLHMVSIACTYVAWSDDQGETWTGRDGQCGTPAVDHPKLGTGPAPEGNPAAGVAHPTVVYQCFNTPQVFGFAFRCAMSYDGGETFPVTTSPFNIANDACSMLGGVVATGPDGAVAVASGF